MWREGLKFFFYFLTETLLFSLIKKYACVCMYVCVFVCVFWMFVCLFVFIFKTFASFCEEKGWSFLSIFDRNTLVSSEYKRCMCTPVCVYVCLIGWYMYVDLYSNTFVSFCEKQALWSFGVFAEKAFVCVCVYVYMHVWEDGICMLVDVSLPLCLSLKQERRHFLAFLPKKHFCVFMLTWHELVVDI